MSKSFTLRLPNDLATWIDENADNNRSQFVIDALRSVMERDVRQSVLQIQDGEARAVRQVQDNLSYSTSYNLQDSIDKLTAAVEASTQQQADLAVQLSQLQLVATPDSSTAKETRPAAPTPEKMPSAKATPSQKQKPKKAAKKAKKKTTKRGGKPAPVYLYNGVEATVREHLQRALPDISKQDLSAARRRVTQLINGRADRPNTKTKSPQDALKHVIERWQCT